MRHKGQIQSYLLVFVLSWFFLAHSWNGLGGTPKEQTEMFYGPFKTKAICEDIRRQVKAITECWEA